MQFGFVLPVSDPVAAIDLAVQAEANGWDGVFVAELPYGTDAWVTLAAIAARTERIRLGTMLTPVARMRPWKLAGEVATLDRISNGRAVLAVGLGAIDTGYAEFGEVTDRRTRIELTEEALVIIQQLWSGEPFAFSGKHFQVDTSTLTPDITVWQPKLVQQPRVPIWITGAWPREVSMRRALPYDGVLPNVFGDDGKLRTTTVDDIRAIHAYVAANRTAAGPFDIIVEGESNANDSADLAKVREWEQAGGTWWIESSWSHVDELDFLRNRIFAGPPK